MTNVDVKLSEDYREDGLNLRKVQLRLRSGQYFEAYPAVNPLKVKASTLRLLGNDVIYENSVNVTLDRLREIDNDAEAQRDFIKRELRIGRYENVSLNLINLLIRPTENIEKQDIDYIRALIELYSIQTIAVPPVVYHYETKIYTRTIGGLPTQLTRTYKTTALPFEEYLSFTKRFLESSVSSGIGNALAMTIPCNIPFSGVLKLASIYRDFATPIVISDGHGQEQLTMFPQVNSLLQSKEIPSIVQKHGEQFMLYGFDSAKSKMNRGAGEIATAKNVLQHFYKFSSFGPRHTFPKMKISNREGSPNPEPRIYFKEEHGYARRGYKDAFSKIDEWIRSNGYSHYSGGAGSDYSNFVKDYEAVKLIETSKEIYSHLKRRELERLIQRGTLKSEINSVKSVLIGDSS